MVYCRMARKSLPPGAAPSTQTLFHFADDTAESSKPLVAPPPEELAPAIPETPSAPQLARRAEGGVRAGNGKSTPRVRKHRGKRQATGYAPMECSLGVGVRTALATAAKAAGMSRTRFAEFLLRRAVMGKSWSRLIEAARRASAKE